MAGLIKKQILKHLSRFAKNLSPDKINLSTLKGEGQLTNLELDEEVLQSLLDLPTWLAISRVWCKQATIRIPWTKLKTHPISLTLDKVVMEMSTCDEPRPPNGPSPIATASGQSEYGFAEKVVEGMSLTIGSIVVRIRAKAFNASLELSQLQVHSVNTSWSPSDLRFTRILDPSRGEMLTFKEISWQMIRIEADAIQSGEHETLSAPIRLITNQSRIRVTLKRRMKDCNVVASKLVLILDDLLWVLTDSQLKAMVQYAKSLSEAMERSAQQRKSLATEVQAPSAHPTAQQVRSQQAPASEQSASMATLFNTFDVLETSHHLEVTQLDLHICDDLHATDRVINKGITGGAMQLSFSSITLDYYPFHRAGDSCLHWGHYSEATKAREQWARVLLEEFSCVSGRDQQGAAQGSPQHEESAGGGLAPPVQCCWCLEPGKISTGSSASFSPQSSRSLMSSSLVLRMADFCIYQVSTADQRRSSPKAMISCNKKTLYLPAEMPAVHMEFTEYYYTDGKDYATPCPNLYIQLNALQVALDPRSLQWVSLFCLDLRHSLQQFMELYKLSDAQRPHEDQLDVKVDGLMLKLVLPGNQAPPPGGQAPPPGGQSPACLSVQASELVASNTRHAAHCTRPDLQRLLQAFREQPFFCGPRGAPPAPPLARAFLRGAGGRGLWALHCSQLWVDYEGGGRPQPCVDAFPLTLWACLPPPRPAEGLSRSVSMETPGRLQRKRLLKEYYSTHVSAATSPSCDGTASSNGLHRPLSLDDLPPHPPSPSSSSADAHVHVLVHVHKHLSAQVSHSQLLFLLSLQRSMASLWRTLQEDQASTPGPPAPPPRLGLGLLLPSADVSLLLRPAPSGEPPRGAQRCPSPDAERCLLSGGVVEPGPAPMEPCHAPARKASLEEGGSVSSGGGCSSSGGGSTSDLRGPGEADGDKLDASIQPSSRKGSLSVVPDLLSSSPSSRSTSLYSVSNIGRLLRERSQPSLSVSYRPVKKSPSLGSLGSLSLDGCLLEDTDSLLDRDDVSISGFKDPESEIATEAVIGPEQDHSPDAVSTASHSTDDPTADIVSVLVVKLQQVCVGLEMEGDSSAVTVEVARVQPSEQGNVSLRQYLSNRSLAGVEGRGGQAEVRGPPEVQARLESGQRAGARSPLAKRNGFLQLRLHGYQASFLLSTLRNLAHFLDDDGTSQVLPMEISLRDAHVSVKDDAPRDNLSDPEPTPICLHVDGLMIRRHDDGSFSIGVNPESSLIDGCLTPVPETMGVAGGITRATQTQDPPTSPTPPSRDEMLIEENECLKLELSRAKMALAEAQMDKDSLLHRLKSLHTPSS